MIDLYPCHVGASGATKAEPTYYFYDQENRATRIDVQSTVGPGSEDYSYDSLGAKLTGGGAAYTWDGNALLAKHEAGAAPAPPSRPDSSLQYPISSLHHSTPNPLPQNARLSNSR